MNDKKNGELNDATVIIPHHTLESATEVIDEATVVVSGVTSVEEETITNSKPVEENTVSSPTRTGDTGQSFTGSTEAPAPIPTRAIPIVSEDVQPDIELKVETFVDPEVALQAQRVTTIQPLSEVPSRPAYEVPVPKPNALNDAAKLMKKNQKRAASQGSTTLILVVVGATLIGATLAILLNGN
ncbi:MAG: hypothetical protein RL197_174 [Actinomycetota bacterium]|jgi:hypothetical protein